MSFSVRPFSACVEALRQAEPDEELNSATENLEHYDSAEAHSYDTIGEWADDPPLSVLYRQKNPMGSSRELLQKPKSFVDYCNFGGAVATWNANGEGRWKHGEDWIVVDVELVQEQAEADCGACGDGGGGGDYVSVIFALWKVEEGWAAAVWRPGERDVLTKVMGFDPWNDKDTGDWQACSVWYGE
jgi:hypothetical protein